jgi:hypothetical protein
VGVFWKLSSKIIKNKMISRSANLLLRSPLNKQMMMLTRPSVAYLYNTQQRSFRQVNNLHEINYTAQQELL